MADTTQPAIDLAMLELKGALAQPAGALPEPDAYIVTRLVDVGIGMDREPILSWEPGEEHEDSEPLHAQSKLCALMAERDSLAAQVKQLAGAHVAWLDERDALRRDRDLEKRIRKDYVDALEDMRRELEELRAERDRLRIRGAAYEEAYGIAHQATYQSHTGHWDSKGTHGANCPQCIRAREARENCDAALKRGLEALIGRAAAPIPRDAREEREPLTEAEIMSDVGHRWSERHSDWRHFFISGVRYAEKHHRIGPAGTSAERNDHG